MKESFEGLAHRLLSGNVHLEDAVEILERGMIEGALQLSRDNQSAAAKRLGIHRNTLLRKMTAYGIGHGRVGRKPAARAARRPKRAAEAA
jgi:DNA-binding NtrC family response regulator